MILTTTPTTEGTRIRAYHGIVTGEAIISANTLKDLLDGLQELVGGRPTDYEPELRDAREKGAAAHRGSGGTEGADAVVGVSVDYEAFSHGEMMLMLMLMLMLMVTATGTAVSTD